MTILFTIGKTRTTTVLITKSRTPVTVAFANACAAGNVLYTSRRWFESDRDPSSLERHSSRDSDFMDSHQHLRQRKRLQYKLFGRACAVQHYYKCIWNAPRMLPSMSVFIMSHDAGERSLLDLLIAQSHRWYIAELCISPPEYELLDAVSGCIPRLHALPFNV
jgi:hypothetical protein